MQPFSSSLPGSSLWFLILLLLKKCRGGWRMAPKPISARACALMFPAAFIPIASGSAIRSQKYSHHRPKTKNISIGVSISLAFATTFPSTLKSLARSGMTSKRQTLGNSCSSTGRRRGLSPRKSDCFSRPHFLWPRSGMKTPNSGKFVFVNRAAKRSLTA